MNAGYSHVNRLDMYRNPEHFLKALLHLPMQRLPLDVQLGK